MFRWLCKVSLAKNRILSFPPLNKLKYYHLLMSLYVQERRLKAEADLRYVEHLCRRTKKFILSLKIITPIQLFDVGRSASARVSDISVCFLIFLGYIVLKNHGSLLLTYLLKIISLRSPFPSKFQICYMPVNEVSNVQR